MKSSEKFEKQFIRSDLYNVFNENCSSYIIKVGELFKPALLKSDLNQILKKKCSAYIISIKLVQREYDSLHINIVVYKLGIGFANLQTLKAYCRLKTLYSLLLVSSSSITV